MIIINIYWGDLSEEGQDALINAGFVVSENQRILKESIGIIKTKNTTPAEQPIILMNEAAIHTLYDEASEAKYEGNNEYVTTLEGAYREGYTDCYNRIKRRTVLYD